MQTRMDFDGNDYHKKLSDFFIPVKVLGRGSYGLVILAIDKKNSCKVAVKVKGTWSLS